MSGSKGSKNYVPYIFVLILFLPFFINGGGCGGQLISSEDAPDIQLLIDNEQTVDDVSVAQETTDQMANALGDKIGQLVLADLGKSQGAESNLSVSDNFPPGKSGNLLCQELGADVCSLEADNTDCILTINKELNFNNLLADTLLLNGMLAETAEVKILGCFVGNANTDNISFTVKASNLNLQITGPNGTGQVMGFSGSFNNVNCDSSSCTFDKDLEILIQFVTSKGGNINCMKSKGQTPNCDSDKDGDGFYDSEDNCVDDANPDQSDIDGDKIGDVCDPTDDRPKPDEPVVSNCESGQTECKNGHEDCAGNEYCEDGCCVVDENSEPNCQNTGAVENAPCLFLPLIVDALDEVPGSTEELENLLKDPKFDHITCGTLGLGNGCPVRNARSGDHCCNQLKSECSPWFGGSGFDCALFGEENSDKELFEAFIAKIIDDSEKEPTCANLHLGFFGEPVGTCEQTGDPNSSLECCVGPCSSGARCGTNGVDFTVEPPDQTGADQGCQEALDHPLTQCNLFGGCCEFLCQFDPDNGCRNDDDCSEGSLCRDGCCREICGGVIENQCGEGFPECPEGKQCVGECCVTPIPRCVNGQPRCQPGDVGEEAPNDYCKRITGNENATCALRLRCCISR